MSKRRRLSEGAENYLLEVSDESGLMRKSDAKSTYFKKIAGASKDKLRKGKAVKNFMEDDE